MIQRDLSSKKLTQPQSSSLKKITVPINPFELTIDKPKLSWFFENLQLYRFGTELCSFSIFDSKHKKRKEVVAKLTGKLPFSSEAESRAYGSLYGMIVGDAIGAKLEFQRVCYDKVFVIDMGNKTEGRFHLEPGQWTDDSSMGFCLADSLIINNGNWSRMIVCSDFLHGGILGTITHFEI